MELAASFVNNLPVDTPLHRLVALAYSRWPMEQFYEDAKDKYGLDYCQGQRWDGLHWHLALVMLIYNFLACQRCTFAIPADFSLLWGAPLLPGGLSPGLVWLFQDVVLWFMVTNQIAHFRLRQI
jgi:hypothetical protein